MFYANYFNVGASSLFPYDQGDAMFEYSVVGGVVEDPRSIEDWVAKIQSTSSNRVKRLEEVCTHAEKVWADIEKKAQDEKS